MNKLFIIILLLLAASFLLSQTEAEKPLVQETVTLLETTPLNDALQVLESLSYRYERKKIINLTNNNNSINVPIHNLTWRKALELILLQQQLISEEKVGVIYVTTPTIAKKTDEDRVKEIDVFNRQVRISAVAFNVDKAYLRSLGIDWSTLLDGKVKANINFKGATPVPGDLLTMGGNRTTTINGQTIEVNTLLKFIESNQLGTIIARPNITVSSGKKGYIQVGQDISVKKVDDAGNTTDQFFATGVILDVEPLVVKADTTFVINLKATVERSSASPGTISTVINKNKSSTEIILYNGEETVIGGLYDTDEIKVRGGIPFLKDLPWWVFGIRYLTGYYRIEKKERELIIIIKAEILDDALTRMKNK